MESTVNSSIFFAQQVRCLLTQKRKEGEGRNGHIFLPLYLSLSLLVTAKILFSTTAAATAAAAAAAAEPKGLLCQSNFIFQPGEEEGWGKKVSTQKKGQKGGGGRRTRNCKTF